MARPCHASTAPLLHLQHHIASRLLAARCASDARPALRLFRVSITHAFPSPPCSFRSTDYVLPADKNSAPGATWVVRYSKHAFKE